MFPVDWHRLVALCLWISPHVLLGVLAVISCKLRLYREFPCFFAYVFYEIANFILLLVLRSVPSVTGSQYVYVYYATLMISVALRFGVIAEVAKDLFQDSPFLMVSARRSLQCVQGLLFVIGVLLAVYAPGHNDVKWIAGASIVNRGAALTQSGLLLFLLLFSRFLGVSWRRPAFGITLGLGILTSVDLAVYALRAEFAGNAWVPYLDWMRTGTYLICVLIWIGYLLASETELASLTVISSDEVEIWNRELQHLVRH
jgi:hypothetical protein